MESPFQPSAAGCCAFLRRPSSLSRLAYRPLPASDAPEPLPVRVVVGKERRVFFVDPFVLDLDPFRILMDMAGDPSRRHRKGAVFIDVDAILFEHMLWLVNDERSSSATLFQPNLKEIIDFYSQDY